MSEINTACDIENYTIIYNSSEIILCLTVEKKTTKKTFLTVN